MNINFKVTAKVKVIYSHHLDSSTESPLCSWKPTCSRYKLRASKGQILRLRWPWAASFRKTEGSSFNYCQNHGALWVSTASFLMPGWFLHFFFFCLVQPHLPSLFSTWATMQGQQPEGKEGEFRNMGSVERLGCQPPKHFPAEEEISMKKWMRILGMANGAWDLKRGGKQKGYDGWGVEIKGLGES